MSGRCSSVSGIRKIAKQEKERPHALICNLGSHNLLAHNSRLLMEESMTRVIFGIVAALIMMPNFTHAQSKTRSSTIDTGSTVRKQFEYNTNHSGNTYIYGGSTTTYPSNRYPGQEYRPPNPYQQPRSTYDAGIGFRF